MAKLDNLTSATTRHIRDFIGKCENCGTKKSLHVHHIDEDRKNNVQSNLIVLCGECHKNQAHAGIINKTEQKKLVGNRSKEQKKAVRGILNAAYKRQKGKTSEQEYKKEVKSIFDDLGSGSFDPRKSSWF